MSILLDKAIASIRDLPAEAQDAVARVVLELIDDEQSMVELTVEDAASFEESLAQADRGEFASDDHIRAIWAKHGL